MEQVADHFVDYMNLTKEDWGCKDDSEIEGVVESLSMPECFGVALEKLFNDEEVKAALQNDMVKIYDNVALCKYSNAYHQNERQRTEYSHEIVEYETRVRALVEFMKFTKEDYGCDDERLVVTEDMPLSEFVEMALEKLQKLSLEF